MADSTTSVVKSIDMNQEMLTFVMSNANLAIESITSQEREAAEAIKRVMDKQYGPSWQCIVGRGFKAAITHETKHYAYFYIGALAVLVYRVADNNPLPIAI
eukprot:TRINITY_DN1408_c0_g1_i3.p3 TRINITY_DN1408_c0_g1~~TRINITY_DN1408_c0_g1_i3.p3  ORF type:complete len:101 (-),score=36.38 TRINITY_DN1408_c0_g1_i3:543-845(-)